jgi:hypothetical protein
MMCNVFQKLYSMCERHLQGQYFMYLISHSRTCTHIHHPILLVCRCHVICTIVHFGTTAYLNVSLQMQWVAIFFCVIKCQYVG